MPHGHSRRRLTSTPSFQRDDGEFGDDKGNHRFVLHESQREVLRVVRTGQGGAAARFHAICHAATDLLDGFAYRAFRCGIRMVSTCEPDGTSTSRPIWSSQRPGLAVAGR